VGEELFIEMLRRVAEKDRPEVLERLRAISFAINATKMVAEEGAQDGS
jgi:hypothetical protein